MLSLITTLDTAVQKGVDHAAFAVMRTFGVKLSFLHDDSEVYAFGHSGALILKGWFARKEGIE